MGRAAALIAVASATLACTSPRAQLVVTVSSDLALPSQVAADDTLSAAASIDRVRVESFGADGALADSRDFVLLDSSQFPISFGVRPSHGRAAVRVTGFREAWAALKPDGTPLPAPGVSVERLLTASVGGLADVELALRGDCVGLTSDLAADTTCTDAAHASAAAENATDAPGTATASWAPAHAVACSGAPPAGTICIAGGASAVGDPALVTVDATSDLVAAPPRMVVLAPFFLDATELTVKQFRALVAAGLQAPLPTPSSADPRCNYTPAASGAENQAVRCVPFATARAACRALGGDLPTAAQWEHAARGRGRGTRYPWGDAPPACCDAALAVGVFGCTPCAGMATELVVGTHPADVSRDGVLDLGGSVREWVLDAPVGFDDCLAPGVLVNPLCAPSSAPAGSTKGGSFATTREDATSALRRGPESIIDVGFRCVH
jgi:formylglycine-generating enzyme required for sulfatase activity